MKNDLLPEAVIERALKAVEPWLLSIAQNTRPFYIDIYRKNAAKGLAEVVKELLDASE